tara:strand:- start:964 stop:3069 length:2106 start_codon:yes stop_codon:yes gene_type:complete
MATYDFTGTNGDPLPAGLTTVAGGFEISNNTLVATAESSAFTQNSLADSTITVDLSAGGSVSLGTTQVFARWTSNDDYIALLFRHSDGRLNLFVKTAGNFAQLSTSYTIPAYSNTAFYTVSLVTLGTSIKAFYGATEVISSTSSHNQTETISGAELRFINEPSIDNLTIPDGVGSTISISESSIENQVYQRDTDTTAEVSFAVTHVDGSGALQYRLLNAANDTTEIITWTTFDAAPVTSPVTLTFNAPVSADTAYHVEVRRLGDIATTDTQTVGWRAGAVVLIIGQSLASEMSDVGAITAQQGHYEYQSGAAVPTVGLGSKALADALINASNMSVMIINTAVSGSALITTNSSLANYWSLVGSSYFTSTVASVAAATDNANKLEFVWWHQGTTESVYGFPAGEYQTGLGTLFTKVRASFTDRNSSTVKIVSAITGRDTRGTSTDLTRQQVRSEQLSYGATDANFYPLDAYIFAMDDGVHGTDATYIQLGGEIVAAYYAAKGEIAVDAPVVQALLIGDSTSEVDIVYNSGLLVGDSAYSTQGVRVELDGVLQTVSSFARKNTNTANITLSAPLSAGVVKVYVGYGTGSNTSALLYPRSVNAVLPNTGGTYNLTAIAINGNTFTYSLAGSILNLLSTGTPDGSYTADIYNNTTKLLIETKSLTFSGGGSSTTLSTTNTGTETWTLIEGSNAPTTGMAYIGVTE